MVSWCESEFSGNGSNPLHNEADLCVNNIPVTDLIVPGEVNTIGKHAFSYWEGVTSVTILDGITSIHSSAFETCPNLVSVAIPKSVTAIEKAAFFNCELLSDVYYAGSKEEWSKISIGESNDVFTRANIHYAELHTEHIYTDDCDSICNICDKLRIRVPHYYDNACDTACNRCQETRSVGPHRYDNDCDTACNLCQKPRTVEPHKYDNDCDTTCNICQKYRYVEPHKYDNACDTTCNSCQKTRFVGPHRYDNACDTSCDTCGAPRAITHSFGEYVYNNDATLVADGTRTRACTVCGYSETVNAPGTLIVPSVTSNPFKDVKAGVYYEKPVLWAVNKGITNGMGNGKFKPNETCTRGQIVTFLWRAKGCPEPQSAVNPFSDVAANAYYTKAVLWAVEQGITNGTGKGKFSPNAECTREQIVTFLWRSQGKPVMGSANPFSDVASGTYYHNAVLWAVDKGITKGTSATTFAPKDDCTRGQIVTFLYRCLV